MAKSRKVGRPRKKRKYTQHVPEYKTLSAAIKNAKNGDTIIVKPSDKTQTDKDKTIRDLIKDEVNQASQASIEPRASNLSYIFVAGNKTLIRNLSDEFLNNQYESIVTESGEMRRQLSLLESLQFNMSMEQRYRGLK